jgi:hypothetical protein
LAATSVCSTTSWICSICGAWPWKRNISTLRTCAASSARLFRVELAGGGAGALQRALDLLRVEGRAFAAALDDFPRRGCRGAFMDLLRMGH